MLNILHRRHKERFVTIDYPAVLQHRTAPQEWSFADRDAILYALCLGMGSDPMDERNLRFVYEKNLKVMPTFLTTLAWIAAPTFAELGVDPRTALHGEQKIELHGVLSMPSKIHVQGSVIEVYDKGQDRGAVIITRHALTDAADGRAIASLITTCFARGEGGCGGTSAAAPPAHAVPTRACDHSFDVTTPAELALFYRLTGDRNPLHAEPSVAAAAGFERPILHGLCSFGISCRAVLATYADFDPRRIVSHQARFASPVYPGETLTVDLWRDADIVSFEVKVKARGATVIKNGKCVLGETPR
jgi:acyl dehydratase